MRAGMYIGKLGDGTAADDGIYILLKEVVDNSIDEYAMGNGKEIDIKIEEGKAIVRPADPQRVDEDLVTFPLGQDLAKNQNYGPH